ncbi:MAG: acyl carrier protein [Clostridiales bacterium]|nr:acyl carrier protein [Clostridiales bacterium]
MERLIEILKNLKPGVDFNENTELIKNKIFDSLGMISLVAELSDEFDVEITARDIVPENFATVKTIYDMILRLEEED